MDKTETTLRSFLAALPAPGYDLGILSGQGMHRFEAVQLTAVLRMLPYFKYRNANGAHIYLRPTGESTYTLRDDLTPASLAQLTGQGYSPAAVVETSPSSFQAWLRHLQPLSKELGSLAAKTLALQFGADPSAADWRRFGRAPGFTNRKPKHCNAQGIFPFARLHSHTGQAFTAAATFHAHLLTLQYQAKQKHIALRLHYVASRTRFTAPLSLSRFRTSPRFQGRPAAADMAFCIAAYSHGWTQPDIAAALSRDYLSRDTNHTRQAAYISRTLEKASKWAA